MKFNSNILAVIAVGVACNFITQQAVIAAGSKTSTVPGLSTTPSNKPATGGGKRTTTTPTPTPALPALAQGPVTFTATGPVNGVMPVCTGDFRIGAYYPTLLDMTVNVSVSSLNVPDGTILYVNAAGTVGTFYPYTSSNIVIVGGAGICSEKIFVGLGVGLSGVTITDISGTPIFVGK